MIVLQSSRSCTSCLANSQHCYNDLLCNKRFPFIYPASKLSEGSVGAGNVLGISIRPFPAPREIFLEGNRFSYHLNRITCHQKLQQWLNYTQRCLMQR